MFLLSSTEEVCFFNMPEALLVALVSALGTLA